MNQHGSIAVGAKGRLAVVITTDPRMMRDSTGARRASAVVARNLVR